MSRTCMYCGRDLGAKEQCGCPQSVEMRRRREKAANSSTNADAGGNSSSAKSNFNKAESSAKSKQTADKKRSFHTTYSSRPTNSANKRKSALREFWQYARQTLLMPVYKASNPGYVRLWWVFVLVGVHGFMGYTAVYASGGVMQDFFNAFFSRTALLSGFLDMSAPMRLLCAAIFGMIIGYMSYTLLCFSLWGIGRLTRIKIGFREYFERLAPCTVPLAAAGALGLILSSFMPAAATALAVCAAAVSLIMLYEAMRSVWNRQPDITVYMIVSALFFYSAVCCNIYKIFV